MLTEYLKKVLHELFLSNSSDFKLMRLEETTKNSIG